MTGPALPAGVVPADRALRSVLTSAAAALGVPGCENALAVPAGRRVVVALVDGLGRSLLKRFGGHAPTLRSAMADGGRVLEVAVTPRRPPPSRAWAPGWTSGSTAWPATTCSTRTGTW